MADQQDYEVLFNRINAIGGEEIHHTRLPVDILARESEMTAQWAQSDKEKFEAVNFDWSLVESIPVMAGALRWSEVLWSNRRKLQEDAQKLLKELIPAADDLRDEVLYALDYAGDEDEALQARIVEIREGTSYADLVLDCTAVVDLAGEYRDLLDSINFDMSVIDELAGLGDRLAATLGESDVEKLGKSEEKLIRDKAYTLLNNTLRKVRKCGKYVCRNNEERLKGYISQYSRTVYRCQRKKALEQTEAITC